MISIPIYFTAHVGNEEIEFCAGTVEVHLYESGEVEAHWTNADWADKHLPYDVFGKLEGVAIETARELVKKQKEENAAERKSEQKDPNE